VTPDSRLGETETCPALAKDKVVNANTMNEYGERGTAPHTLLTVTLDEGM
jgi:hypothetical protein